MNFEESDAEEASSPKDSSYKFYNNTVEVFFSSADHVYYLYNDKGEREDIPGVTTILQIIAKPFLVPWATKLTIDSLKQNMFHPDGRLKDLSTEELSVWFQEAKDKHKEKLEVAGDIGSLAHDTLEKAIQYAIDNTKGILLECPVVVPLSWDPEAEAHRKQAQHCVDSAYEWCGSHNVRFLRTERKVFSKELHIAGTMDGLAIVDSCADRYCKGCRGRVWKDHTSVIDWKSSNSLHEENALQTAVYLFCEVEEFGTYIPDRWVNRLGKTEGDFEAWHIGPEYFEGDINAFIAARDLQRAVDDVAERRLKDKREFNEFVKEEKKAATAANNTARDLYYKELRTQKLSTAEAKLLSETRYPKQKRGSKTKTEPNTEHKQLALPTAESQPTPEPTAAKTWVLKL